MKRASAQAGARPALLRQGYGGQPSLRLRCCGWLASRSSAGAKAGAQGRDRTADTVIFSHVLYQLSYLGQSALAEKRAAYKGGRPSLSSPSEPPPGASGSALSPGSR